MTLPPIVCANCGAKYRLPETFKADKAKCKKCGSMIDVAAQRSAPAEPAATSPAPGKPAGRARAGTSAARAGRPRREPAGEAPTPRVARASRSGSGSRRSGARRGRRGEPETEEKKKGKGMLIGVGVLVIALAGGGAYMFLGGDDEAELAAQQAAAEQAAAEQAAAEQAAMLVADLDNELATEGVADPDQASNRLATFQQRVDEIAAQNATAAEEATTLLATLRQRVEQAVAEQAAAALAAAEAAASKEEARPAEAVPSPAEGDKPWLTYNITSVEQVFDPKTETEPAKWPDYVTEEERQEITSLIDDVEKGGRAGMAAKTRLEELGHKSLAGIINRLREVDYTDSFDTFFAYELNKLIERLTITINAGFEDVELGSTIDLRVAHWNAKTVQAWLRLLEQYPTKEDWDRLMTSIRARDR